MRRIYAIALLCLMIASASAAVAVSKVQTTAAPQGAPMKHDYDANHKVENVKFLELPLTSALFHTPPTASLLRVLA